MSAVRYLFNSAGNYVAFLRDRHLFSPEAEWFGFLAGKNEVYTSQGIFLGYLLADDRIVRRHGEKKPVLPRPQAPPRPPRPMRPLRRLRMPRVPLPYEDVFADGGPSDLRERDESTDALDHLEGMSLVAADGQLLGVLSRDPYASNSLSNPYAPFGSRYSQTSIFNSYSQYGSPYGLLSPYNRYSTTPPRIFDDDQIVAYLTVNPYITPRIDPEDLTAWLGAA